MRQVQTTIKKEFEIFMKSSSQDEHLSIEFFFKKWELNLEHAKEMRKKKKLEYSDILAYLENINISIYISN